MSASARPLPVLSSSLADSLKSSSLPLPLRRLLSSSFSHRRLLASCASLLLLLLFLFGGGRSLGMSRASEAGAAAGSGGPFSSFPRVVLQRSHPPAPERWKDEGEWRSAQERLGSGGAAEGGGGSSGPEEMQINFKVLLRQDREKIEKIFKEVADPRSPNYGHYLTHEQLAAVVGPSVADQQKAVSYLTQALSLPPSQVVNRGDLIEVHGASIPQVEQAFGCAVHQFREQLAEVTTSSKQDRTHTFSPMQLVAPGIPARPPRVVLRCVGEVSIPQSMAHIIAGTAGLVEMPTRFELGPGRRVDLGTEGQEQEQEGKEQTNVFSRQEAKGGEQASSSLPRAVPLSLGGPAPFTLRSAAQMQRVEAELERQEQFRRQ